MKKFALTCLIVIMSSVLFGQEIKFSIAPIASSIYHYKFVAGGPYGTARFGLSTQFDYLFVTNKKIEFGLGLGYQNSHVQIIIPFTGDNSYSASTETVNLLSLSLRSVFNLKKDFYITFVPTLDFQIKHNSLQRIDNQSGLGLSMGIGNNVKLNESLSLNIEPRLWVHNVIPFSGESIPFRLTTVGLNLGLVFGHKND
jgi:hypothetical protein